MVHTGQWDLYTVACLEAYFALYRQQNPNWSILGLQGLHSPRIRILLYILSPRCYPGMENVQEIPRRIGLDPTFTRLCTIIRLLVGILYLLQLGFGSSL